MSDYEYIQAFETQQLDRAQRQAVLDHGYETPEWRYLRDRNVYFINQALGLPCKTPESQPSPSPSPKSGAAPST